MRKESAYRLTQARCARYKLEVGSDNTQMTIIVEGIKNELVDILVYHSKFQSIIHLICQFSTDKLQAQLIINSTNVICL